MSRKAVFALFFLAVFQQAGAYGLTFLLPDLFATFRADEKTVGAMLLITAIATIITIYYAGHLSDLFGRVRTLGFGCFSIAVALFLFGSASSVGNQLIAASIFLGSGWGITYSLAPVALTGLVDPPERVRYFALLSIFVMAGFGLSPVMTAQLLNAGYDVSDAFYVTATLSALSGIIFLFLVTPIRQIALKSGTEPRSKLTLSNMRTVLSSRAILPIIMVCMGASIFAGMNNFQTVFARLRGLDYADFFLAYTVTVIFFRIILARFKGGSRPYLTISGMQYIMCASIVIFLLMGDSAVLYVLVAVLFGIGYGASYPILVAMAADDANVDLVPQTLQIFALSYFVGIFGFPLIAGWMIVDVSITAMLVLIAVLAFIEASLAFIRATVR